MTKSLIVHWSDEAQAFVPGLAPFKPHGKIKYQWYRRPSTAWTHDDAWRRRIGREYQRWLAERDSVREG